MTELAEADTQVKRADGLVDIAYVIVGRLVHLGYRNLAVARANAPEHLFVLETIFNIAENLKINFKPCWDNIHTSNLSKACSNETEAKKTVAKYKKMGVETIVEEHNSKFLIKVAKEVTITNKQYPNGELFPVGKVLKNINYIPADLLALV